MKIPIDKGAKFKKCDFQVHTLRDLNWKGPFNPTTEREAFSKALIDDCRRKDLQAIAITDHHDLCLWRSVYEAAQNEKNEEGLVVPESERVVVFPGVELTLSAPACQVILLLDPDLDDDTLGYILSAIGVTPANSNHPKTTQTFQLPIDKTIESISNALNQIKLNPEESNPQKINWLRGKFILLPNVKEGGHQALLRKGNHTAYATSPFVGGYIEKCFYSELKLGNKNILEGKVDAWGSKAIGIFQTSDCREVNNIEKDGNKWADFTNLGKWTSWVKWAEPSSEALRQACLARQSRISQTEPTFPLLQIVGVVVSDSKFLGNIELGLNPQFNAFIGGRGTGKSSLLEYIRWAICDDPISIEDGSTELPNYQKRRSALINDTLKPLDAKVTVFYKRNEVLYRIERSTSNKSGNILVFDENNEEESMTPEQIRREFPIVSYAQKQLSCVGTLPEEINRLITDPIKGKLGQIQDNIDKTIIPQLKTHRGKEIRLTLLETQFREGTSAIKGKKEQVQALQSKLSSLNPAQRFIIQKHDVFAKQNQSLFRINELSHEIEKLLEQTRQQIEALTGVTAEADFPDFDKVKNISEEVNEFKKMVVHQLDHFINQAKGQEWMTSDNQKIFEELKTNFEKHQIEYNQCLIENTKNQKQLEEIQNLNKQIAELENRNSTLDSERSSLKVVFDKVGNTKWVEFLDTLNERAELLREQCKKVNQEAQHEFKAEVKFCADRIPLKSALSELLQKRNIRGSEEKIDTLSNLVCNEGHPIKNLGTGYERIRSACSP